MKKNRFFLTLMFLASLFAKNVFLFAEEEIKEFVFEEDVDSHNRLRRMVYEDEIFIPEIKETETVLVNKAGTSVTRSFYDSGKRLIKKEDWEINGAATSKVIRFETLDYHGDSNLINVRSVVTPETEERTEFNEGGLPLRYELYKTWEKEKDDSKKDSATEQNAESDNDSDDEEIEVLKRCSSVTAWLYDGKNRLLSEKTITYLYKTDEDTKPYGKNSEQKNLVYHDLSEDIPPDEIIYVNGKKKSSLLYSGPGEYITDMIFDNGYTVKTFYKKGTRVKEEFYENRKLLRVKEY